ncbi:MAG: DNA helicase RecQ [Methanobrevibacter sp.]|jgi:ATP-dependent DNA helicase RecQ|nr:DNA helicase RecQ [Candidatus Methanovirga aequatorialis]
MEVKSLLKKYFGYDEFLLGQEELINSILSGSDVLGIMPTGSGKSVCYQLPGIIFDGLTIIVSPLISLMKDQVNFLKANGIDSIYINSSLSYEEYYSAMESIDNDECKIVYVAPERLESNDFLEITHENVVSMVAVDEAHCVSQWGHDFRPSYLKIRDFVSKFEKRPVLSAFTATATENVRKDIVKQVGLRKPNIVSTGYDRKNLYFEVRKTKDKFQELLKILDLEGENNNGIIYCNTRKSVERVCDNLVKKSYDAISYHAGLSDGRRHINQEKFILDEKPIIVATNAFGMGIDKSNVNFVVHYNMPKNLENYYQEAGRAGRDGSPAKCILLYSYQDVIINKFLIEKTIESENYEDIKLKERLINENYGLLNKIQGYCTTRGCYRQYILNYFGDSVGDYCGNCYNCIEDFEMVDVKNESFHIVSTIKSLKGGGRSFGKNMIVDILKGGKGKKIRDLSLNQLPSFNQLSGKSKEEIASIIDFLIDEKYLRVSGDRYPVIKLWKNYKNILDTSTTLKMKILRGKMDIVERDHGDKSKSKQTQNDSPSLNESKKDKSSIKLPFNNQISDDLFERLRRLRLKIAKDEGIPPFMIFHDSTLKDMCGKLPTSKAEFLNVNGVGKVKMEKYGEAFIDTIIDSSSSKNGNEINPIKSLKIIKPLKNESSNVNLDLFEELKAIRLKVSKDEGVPPYMIFHDSTLRGMCENLPTSKAEFLNVNGVGKVKMEKYGEIFIDAIKKSRHCKKFT